MTEHQARGFAALGIVIFVAINTIDIDSLVRKVYTNISVHI